MEIWLGYSGLAVSFVILLVTILWSLIQPNMKLRYKLIIIPIFIWYSLVLYYTAPKLMGWPVDISIPAKSIVVGFNIQEPNKIRKGGIYLWVISPKKTSEQKLVERLDPEIIFSYANKEPRAFKIPYSREMHKAIIEAQKRQARQKGSVLIIGKGEKGIDGNSMGGLGIGVFNPIDALPPK